jgi:hypothetical protein
VLPGQGDPTADRLVSQQMGPLVEKTLVPLVQSPNYLRMNDAARAYILSQWLRTIRERAHDAAAMQAPALFEKLRVQQLPKRTRGLLDLLREQ